MRRAVLFLAVFAAAAVAAPGVARAQFPGCAANTSEVDIVEPLNGQVITTSGFFDFGVQALMVASPVPCSLSVNGCYEFGVLPVTYPAGPTSPTVQEVGSPTQPIRGGVQIEIRPFANTSPDNLPALLSVVPSGTWDGSSSAPMFVDPTFNADLGTEIRRGAKVQVPVDFVQNSPQLSAYSSTAGVLALVDGLHTPPSGAQGCGLFSLVKRNTAGNQFAAKSMEAAPTPVLFLRQAGTNKTEVIVVEALNTQFIGTDSPFNFGAQTVNVASPVKRPETICGNPAGDASKLIDCYELAMVYVSYDSTGKQILHLPNYPDPAVPLGIQAPITGRIGADILPVHPQTVSTLFQGAHGDWDGTSTNSGQVFLYTLRNGAIDANTTYTLPTIRIPAAPIQALVPSTLGLRGAVLALVEARHEESNRLEFGFFSPFKRNVVFNQDLGNLMDAATIPIIFTTNPNTPDDREVILVEPQNQQLVTFFGAGANLPVIQCVNVGGVDYFEFGITYVTYAVQAVEVHQAGGSPPIVGDFKVTVSPTIGGASAFATWSGSGSPTTTMFADTTPDADLGTGVYRTAKVRIPKSALGAAPPSGYVLATVLGTHTNASDVASGFYNVAKRNLVHTQAVGNELDNVPTPAVFQMTGTCAPAAP